jgi:hypothetical protein
MGINEQTKLHEQNPSWEANSNMATQKHSLSLQIIDPGSSLPYHIEHVYTSWTPLDNILSQKCPACINMFYFLKLWELAYGK